MINKSIVLLQQRDFGQKMNVSFEFVTRNFAPLVKALMFIAGPAALLAGVAQGMFQSRTLGMAISQDPASMLTKYLAFEYLFVIIFTTVSYFLAYATVSAFITLYEEHSSSVDVTPALVWQKISENIWASLGAMVISFLLSMIGIMFLIIPGLYIGIALQFFMIITIREKLPAMEALKRSQQLIKDKWWSTFGLIMIMSIVASLIAFVFQLPVFITTMLSALGLARDWANMKAFMIGGSMISILGSTIVQGLVWVALVFQYFNLVERTEGSSLRAEIDALGKGDWERPQIEN
jgi:hypothetical protein